MIQYFLVLFFFLGGMGVLSSKNYNEVTWICAHNAMSSQRAGWKFPNQTLRLDEQLALGVRAFMLDVWEDDGNMVLRHGNHPLANAFGRQPLKEALKVFKNYLEAHPSAIITLIFESYVPSAKLIEVVKRVGLDDYAYSKHPQKSWDSMEKMIKMNKRLVVFSDRWEPNLAPWFLSLWQEAWETDWQASHLTELWEAQPRRGNQQNTLFILNHFLTAPWASPRLAKEANSLPFLWNRLQHVRALYKREPNFLVLDFVDIGDIWRIYNMEKKRLVHSIGKKQ